MDLEFPGDKSSPFKIFRAREFVKKQNSLAYPIKKRDIYIQPTRNHQTYIEYLMHVKHCRKNKKNSSCYGEILKSNERSNTNKPIELSRDK